MKKVVKYVSEVELLYNGENYCLFCQLESYSWKYNVNVFYNEKTKKVIFVRKQDIIEGYSLVNKKTTLALLSALNNYCKFDENKEINYIIATNSKLLKEIAREYMNKGYYFMSLYENLCLKEIYPKMSKFAKLYKVLHCFKNNKNYDFVQKEIVPVDIDYSYRQEFEYPWMENPELMCW